VKVDRMKRGTITLVLLVTGATAHISLTYPPARSFDLDFLDSQRTKAPCGMPKGRKRTSLKAGSSVNITWHLAYPHRGGFRLEVLDPKERPIRDLTPVLDAQPFVVGDATAQSFLVDLPADLECVDCSIRLVREAREWGKKYKFWSCADVDILPPSTFFQSCSGHGRPFSGRCRCDRNYYGDSCQYQDDCSKDEDCGGHGRCWDIKATSAPQKQCYCSAGWFGPGCSKKAHTNKKQIQEGLYTRKALSDKLTLSWRVLKEAQEVEMVIQFKGTSWAAVGWRPKSLTASCKKFPVLVDTTESVARSLDFSNGAAKASLESEMVKSAPEPAAQIQTRAARAKKVIKRMTTSVDVGISYVKSSVSSSRSRRSSRMNRRKRETKEEVKRRIRERLVARRKAFAEASQGRRIQRAFAFPVEDTSPATTTSTAVSAEPQPDTTPVAEKEEESEKTESKAEPEPEPEAESEPEPEPEAEAEAEPEAEPEAEAEAEAEPEPAVVGGNSWTPRGDFHGMDCTDMVVGMARGNTHRIGDFYTRDRSTPRRDKFWDGEDDLSSAMGWEEDGVTTLIFRKPLQANGPTDHSILDEEMHVIWAVGQQQGEYSHSPKSGLETEEASLPDFYHEDELKYHGKVNRGTTSINFKKEIARNDQSKLDYCGGEWDYPRGCVVGGGDCQYLARWQFDENSDKINFTIQSKSDDNKNKWTGIGFSDTPSMRLTDAIIGWVEPNGRTFIMDMWITNYLNPILESRQDITDMSGTLEDGVTTIRFTRLRDTGDSQDVAFSDTEGMYMIFPVKGGRYNGVNKKIRKHEQVPIASSERIFIKNCRTPDGKATFTTTPKPPQLIYRAKLKFVETGNYKLPREGSVEYTELQERISRSLRSTKLSQVPGFQDVAVVKFYSKEDGEFETDLVVIIDKNEFEESTDALSVEEALQLSLSRGKLGNLKVDPASFSLGGVVTTNEEQGEGRELSDGTSPNVKLYVVVACIAALVLVAIIQASCTIFKMSRRGSSVQKEKLLGHGHGWKDYSAHGGGGQSGGAAAHHHGPAYHYNDSFETDGGGDLKAGWQMGGGGRNGTYDRQKNQSTHSLPRPHHGGSGHGGGAGHHPMGYSSYDRRAGGFTARPPGPADYPPDHYFMPSQRKYSGEVLRVYVDYNK